MTLQQSVRNLFQQLEESLVQLSDEQYTKSVETLSAATIGQHVRHVVEMFVCLQEGYDAGVVNYETRKRDVTIERSKDVAIGLMQEIISSLYSVNKALILEAGFDENSNELNKLPTNYFREIAYNLEHAIHHMALIKIGINQVSDIQLPIRYGVASSTLKYRKTQKIAKPNELANKKKNLLLAVKVAFVVGIILNLINNYNPIFLLEFNVRTVVKILLTFLVPFCVSLYTSLNTKK